MSPRFVLTVFLLRPDRFVVVAIVVRVRSLLLIFFADLVRCCCCLSQIFFNSEHLGGNDDLQKLHEEGKLEGLVAKVRDEAPGMMKATWYHPWY